MAGFTIVNTEECCCNCPEDPPKCQKCTHLKKKGHNSETLTLNCAICNDLLSKHVDFNYHKNCNIDGQLSVKYILDLVKSCNYDEEQFREMIKKMDLVFEELVKVECLKLCTFKAYFENLENVAPRCTKYLGDKCRNEKCKVRCPQ